MSVNTFSKRTEIDLRSIQLRSILVWPIQPQSLLEECHGKTLKYNRRNMNDQLYGIYNDEAKE